MKQKIAVTVDNACACASHGCGTHPSASKRPLVTSLAACIVPLARYMLDNARCNCIQAPIGAINTYAQPGWMAFGGGRREDWRAFGGAGQ